MLGWPAKVMEKMESIETGGRRLQRLLLRVAAMTFATGQVICVAGKQVPAKDVTQGSGAQQAAQTAGNGVALTWEEVRARFESGNPSLRAGVIGIEEAKAQEVTAYLRPNPNFTALLDQVDPFSTNPSQPLALAQPVGSLTYLYERDHKRELRRDSAKAATRIAISNQSDLERNLLFTLRNSFVQILQQKSVLALA